jgi:hypothetical protein
VTAGSAPLKSLLLLLALACSGAALAQPALVPSKEFQFPSPRADPAVHPANLVLATTGSERAARLASEALFASIITASTLAAIQSSRPELLLNAPVILGSSVTLMGWSKGGRGALGWTLLGAYAGYLVGSLALQSTENFAALVPGLLFSVLAYELSSYVNERERVVAQELEYIGSSGLPEEPPTIGSLHQVSPGIRATRIVTGLVATVVGGFALSYGTGFVTARLIGCECQADLGSNEPLVIFPILYMLPALVAFPMVTHGYGQLWGGRGSIWFGMLGTYLGLGAAVVALVAGLGPLALLAIPIGAVTGWEISSLVREHLRAPAPPQAAPAALSPVASWR